jgi:chromosome segregation ATPase
MTMGTAFVQLHQALKEELTQKLTELNAALRSVTEKTTASLQNTQIDIAARVNAMKQKVEELKAQVQTLKQEMARTPNTPSSPNEG